MNFQKMTAPNNFSKLHGTLNPVLSVKCSVISETYLWVLESEKITSSGFLLLTENIRT